MLIGILDCDRVDAQLVGRFGEYSQMVSAGLTALNPGLGFRMYDALRGQRPTTLSECDAYIITGSRHNAYDDLPWIEGLRKLVRRAATGRAPLAGICFGHQLIASAMGGQVARSAKGWGLGNACYPLLRHQSWMVPAREQICLLTSHQDQVVRLPDGALRLAGNAFCEHFMFQLGERLVGIQGHPEFVPDYARALLDQRREQLPAEQAARAQASLATPHDGPLLLLWLLNFFGIGGRLPGDGDEEREAALSPVR